jgi:hypothetical protein
VIICIFVSGNAHIAAVGCQALAALVLRQPAHCAIVMQNNGHHVILQTMKVHPNDENVQVCIRSIVFILQFLEEAGPPWPSSLSV